MLLQRRERACKLLASAASWRAERAQLRPKEKIWGEEKNWGIKKSPDVNELLSQLDLHTGERALRSLMPFRITRGKSKMNMCFRISDRAFPESDRVFSEIRPCVFWN